ncbi:hypothetical protein BC938DRAFT_476695 [Jimgerdemannia flammicorona]|uniref:DhaK domain-containing protein n=1 Tax=Jimgerdemannia flammicorona TaxID=994334 RepID=A0A433PF16_9FUNG|nr:hypothetical protein BC938DRAFT_476695 [Jimgerdemannia flammicorona]
MLYSTGHEPAHVAFVGPSILTAAVTAHVFVSPSASLILAALRPACPPHGTLDHQELYGRYPCTLAWPRWQSRVDGDGGDYDTILRAWLMLSMGIHSEPGYCKTSLLPFWRTYLTLRSAPCSIQLTHTALTFHSKLPRTRSYYLSTTWGP